MSSLPQKHILSQPNNGQPVLVECSYCHKVRDSKESLQQSWRPPSEHRFHNASHGVCPECFPQAVASLVNDILDENRGLRATS